jgi:hypothetical protein
MLDVLGVKEINKLIPMAEDQLPEDPITENQNALMMKPMKAFLYQDHQAHITVHMTAMQDPKIQQLLQGNPMAQQIQAAMQNHINEHLGFEYRKQIEQQLGMQLPPQFDDAGEQTHMSPEVEAKLSPLLAQAAQRLLAQNQQQAAQQQAQQQAQDPLVQMQMQELQLKQQDLQRKSQKDQADIALKQSQQQIEKLRIASQEQMSRKKDMTSLLGDAVKQQAEQAHEKAIQQRDLMADGLKTALVEHGKRVTHNNGIIADAQKVNNERTGTDNQRSE